MPGILVRWRSPLFASALVALAAQRARILFT